MKLENQAVNLDIAMKLKELGAEQKSLWHWVKNEFDEDVIISDCVAKCDGFIITSSAFTVAELGEMLPYIVGSGKTEFKSPQKRWECSDYEIDIPHDHRCIRDEGIIKEIIYAETEANARAKMLIYLIENDLYDV